MLPAWDELKAKETICPFLTAIKFAALGWAP
jgi:hypothetical protein